MVRNNTAKHRPTRGITGGGRIAREIFVDAITTDSGKGRIKRSAQKAYPNQNDNAAHVTGSRMLRDPTIQAMIRKRLDNAAKWANIKREEIVGTLAQAATSSLTDVLNDEGQLDWNLAKARGKDHLIKEVVVTDRHSKDGSSRTTTTYKMEDKIRAADLLSDLKGWKKQAAPNPIDSAKEMLQILRQDAKFAELDEALLRQMVACRVNVAESDLISEANN